MRIFAFLGFVLVACALPASEEAVLPNRDDVGTPLHKAWFMATHNSYWVDRGYDDAFGSGVNLRILDQLLAHGVRGLEIDIHRSRTLPHEFDVHHTSPGNTVCPTLRKCLHELRAFHDALPQHEVVHVIFEFKEIYEGFFDDTHSILDLDRVFTEEMDELLYRPRNLMARCPGAADLRACVADQGWPSAEYLRGKFIFVMLGNWDDIAKAANTAAWAQYASAPGMAGRAAFAMASAWKQEYKRLPYTVKNGVTEAQFKLAQKQSPYLQIEDLADSQIAPFLAANGMIRAGAADTITSQTEKLNLGIQMLQTDYPWDRPGGPVGRSPLRPIVGDASNLIEPGKIYELPNPATETVQALWFKRPAALSGEVTLSSGRSTRLACAVIANAGHNEWRGLCFGKHNLPGKNEHESQKLGLITCESKACTLKSLVSMAADVGATARFEQYASTHGACLNMMVRSTSEADGLRLWRTVDTFCPGELSTDFGLLTLAPEAATDATFAAGLRFLDGNGQSVNHPAPMAESVSGISW